MTEPLVRHQGGPARTTVALPVVGQVLVVPTFTSASCVAVNRDAQYSVVAGPSPATWLTVSVYDVARWDGGTMMSKWWMERAIAAVSELVERDERAKLLRAIAALALRRATAAPVGDGWLSREGMHDRLAEAVAVLLQAEPPAEPNA